MSTAKLLLEPAVIEVLGGEERADLFLHAEAFRLLVEDGPFVWEMCHDQIKRAHGEFLEQWEKGDNADKAHLTALIQAAASSMNRHRPTPRLPLHWNTYDGTYRFMKTLNDQGSSDPHRD